MARDHSISAIDVGTSKITTLIGTGTEEGVNILGVSTVPSRGLRKGQVVNIEEATIFMISFTCTSTYKYYYN